MLITCCFITLYSKIAVVLNFGLVLYLKIMSPFSALPSNLFSLCDKL